MLPADSVQWAATAIQCDTVAARYRRAILAAGGDSTWPLMPVSLLRVGPTRWIANAYISNGPNTRDYLILDSSLVVVKILTTVR